MTLDSVRRMVLKRAASHAKQRGSTGVRPWCEAHGIVVSHAFEFMNGQRNPATDLLEVLGLEWRVARKRQERGE